MNVLAESLIERFAPRVLWARRIQAWRIETGEAEQELLPWACQRGKSSLDIGAADGSYLPRLLLHSARVVAFEPRHAAAEELRRLYRNTRQVRIESVALSNAIGRVDMRVSSTRPMLSTIDPLNPLDELDGEQGVESVERKRLDDYGFDAIGFIKIDVEGHEEAVLEGGRQTIARARPRVLIEAEERHRRGAIVSVARFFKELNYLGFFLFDGKLRPITEFELAKHQDTAQLSTQGRRVGTYINNFLFLPSEEVGIVPSSYRTANEA